MERRTKNSGLRKGPHLSSWIWCMFIKVFCLPCIFSECLGSNITLSIQPPGDIRILYGDPLEIFCMTEGVDGVDELELLAKSGPLKTERVNDTTIRYYEKRPEKQVTLFHCNNKRINQKCSSKVVVDDLPQEIKVFNCLSKNLNELNCSWVPSKALMVVNYNLTFVVNDRAVHPCKVHYESNVSWCVWKSSNSEDGGPLYRQQLDIYQFNLTSCNFFGCISQHFTIDHFSIVKPDAPTAVEVIHSSPHMITLQWKISNNMVDLLKGGVDHRIEYQTSQLDNSTAFHKVDASDLPARNRTYKFDLYLPHPHWEYEVRIYIRPKKAKLEQYWSEYAYIMVNTTSDLPARSPPMPAGSFHQQLYVTHRLLKIYWSQLDEFEEAGANFTYRVVVIQENKPETIYPENKSLSYISLNASSGPLQVMVWSENAVGISHNYSDLYIPSEADTKTLSVQSFTKLAHENGTNELSWKKIKHKIDNYTLFWCELNTTQTCTGRMNYTTLPPDISKHSINLPMSTLYQFAISANRGLKSSGMTWAYCDIPTKGMEWYQIPVMLTHNSVVGTTFVNLNWEVQCIFSDGFLKGYIIYYCPVIDTTASCTGGTNYTIHIHNAEEKSIKVENLLPYTTYQFTIALNTSSGVRQHNNTDRVTTLEDTPTKPLNVKIKDITYNSVNITWDAPDHTNGKIIIYNITKTFPDGNTYYEIEDSLTYHQVYGLQGLTNYTFAVKACNYNAKHHCSRIDPEDEVFVRTRIGPPGKIGSAPQYNNSRGTIHWFAPGTVDLYQVMILKDKKEYDIHNTTELSYQTIYCEGDEMSYQVRAINFDADQYHGVLGDERYVAHPTRSKDDVDEYVGEWSQTYNMPCGQSGGLTLTLIILGVFLVVGVGYGSLKLYKKMKQMEDIKPVFPNGLSVPEKDLTKYGFGGWNQTNKDEKPSSDEMLLLPNSKSSVSPVSPGVKQSIDNCDSSDHTDSTALSNNSEGPIDRQSSISDTASDSSLRLDIDQARGHENAIQGEASVSESESSRENSPYLNDQAFKKNPTSGYVQSVINPNTDLNPSPLKVPPQLAKSPTQPASTSYVMAGLPQPIFTTGLMPAASPPPAGYVRADDPQARLMNLPKLGPSPTKLFGPESLPTLPLPSPKKGEDTSYIQLQCLESLPNMKVREPAPKPAASGYVSPGDAVLSKHLNNMMAARAPVPDAPIQLDSDMSPDAYCRFSWSKDPSIDNFNSILVDSTLTTPKN